MSNYVKDIQVDGTRHTGHKPAICVVCLHAMFYTSTTECGRCHADSNGRLKKGYSDERYTKGLYSMIESVEPVFP